MGKYSKYNLYRKYITSDGVNYTPLDEYQAVENGFGVECNELKGLAFLSSSGRTRIIYNDVSTYKNYDEYIQSGVYLYEVLELKSTNTTYDITDNFPSSSSRYRFNYANVLEFLLFPNTSGVTDMSSMFNYCTSLRYINLSNFNTSNVTNMGDMFAYCISLTSLDVSSFNTSKVTDMNQMFSECRSLTSLDLSNFDTSKVTDMSDMFEGCSGLTSIDVSNFNTSNVTQMDGMFSECRSLTSLDLSNFDTSNIVHNDYIYGIFYGCRSLTSLDLSGWNLGKISDSYVNLFEDCNNLTTIYMRGCNQATIDKINTSKPTNAQIITD